MMIFILCISCTCSISFLLSFPTRRSSDLGAHHRVGQGGGVGDQLVPVVVEGLDPFGLGADRGARCAQQIRFLDRKSTRLNSSHVAISYVVFCLKKKNTLTQ